jgi:hypothetical protein
VSLVETDRGRLLRESAVDLIRASDLKPELAALRVRQVINDLAVIEQGLKVELRLTPVAAQLRSVA